MTSHAERVGRNEALFREINERIEEIGFGGDAEFLCECGRAECTAPIALTLAEYEAVRAHPARFLILPGHEIPDVENVVEEYDRYAVVEKRPGVPTQVARETDPRSS